MLCFVIKNINIIDVVQAYFFLARQAQVQEEYAACQQSQIQGEKIGTHNIPASH